MIIKIGRKIYYDKLTGGIILELGECQGYLIETTIEQDFECFIELNQRIPSTVGLIQLEYGQLREEFARCSGYMVDTTKPVIDHTTIVFNYDQPLPEPQPYQPTNAELAQQVEDLRIDLMIAGVIV